MKLEFDVSKPNTATIQFRIDPNTKKMLTAVRKHYGVGTGQLLKKMIQECHKSIKEELWQSMNLLQSYNLLKIKTR